MNLPSQEPAVEAINHQSRDKGICATVKMRGLILSLIRVIK